MNTPHTSSWRRFKELYAYRHEPERARELAGFLWRGLLVFCAVGMVSALIFAASIFWSVMSKLSSAAGGGLQQSSLLDRAQLQSTLRLIEERRAAFDVKKVSPAPVVDPSK